MQTLTQPAITVSELDLDRLDELLRGPTDPIGKVLLAELDRASVVAPEAVPADLVTMNSRVRFVVEPGSSEHEKTLVYPRNYHGEGDRLPVTTPAGAALLGLRVGQTIVWRDGAGRPQTLRVLELGYQPERAGRYDL